MNAEQVKSRRSAPANVARVGVVVGAVLLTSALVIQRSEGAFSDTTEYGGNHFGAGLVELTNDGAGDNPLELENATPGKTVTQCVTVTYSGTVTPTKPIKMYAKKIMPFNLAPYLNTTIVIGDEGATCNSIGSPSTLFTGTMEGFANAHTDFDTGLSTGWTPASATADTVRPVRVTVTVADDNAAQQKSADMSFWWEVQS